MNLKADLIASIFYALMILLIAVGLLCFGGG